MSEDRHLKAALGNDKGSTLSRLEEAYLASLWLVEIVTTGFLPFALPGLPFLPLMLISVWSAIGLLYGWTRLCSVYLTDCIY